LSVAWIKVWAVGLFGALACHVAIKAGVGNNTVQYNTIYLFQTLRSIATQLRERNRQTGTNKTEKKH